MKTDTKIAVAIIGCGAVAEVSHLPTLAAAAALEGAVLVDRDRARASQLAAKFGIKRVADDYRAVLGDIDAVIIAVPHPLHAAIAIDCLAAGKHVLCEKPLCVSQAEGEAMKQAAASSGCLLAAGLMRRQAPSYREAARLLAGGQLGRPLRFDLREGGPLDWPIASASFWSKQAVGGGVLLDTGPHTLDLLTWWLGDWARVEYRDDSLGNVEANCRLDVTMANGATGQVILSRTHDPGSRYHIECEHGWLDVIPHEFNFLRCYDARRNEYRELRLYPQAPAPGQSPRPTDYDQLFAMQWRAFNQGLGGNRTLCVQAGDCLSSIRLIEACYAGRQPLHQTWVEA